MRLQRLVALLVVAILACLSIVLLRGHRPSYSPLNTSPLPPPASPPPHSSSPLYSPQLPSEHSESHGPDFPETEHPMSGLISNADQQFNQLRSRQSKTLTDAVNEYRRRYGMNPPPHFDKWFQFAKARGVQLIDEYDTIYHSLLPFWALEPKKIRERAHEALGFDNSMMGVLIRDGKVTLVEGGTEEQQWQRDATAGMMKSFIKHLPDMDLVFNAHDEPRVILPSEDLQRLVSIAKDHAIPSAFQNQRPVNAWSPKPAELNKGDRIDEIRTTRFNRFAHQPTWTSSRASCPVDSPARSLDENALDIVDAYALGELGYVYNTTAFSDICTSPSLRNKFGFLERANAFDVVRDLFPVFSQSKISSFQDILYPSPWYWADNVPYIEARDFNWEDKQDKMYWRGSTTGGFSRGGGWRRHHRQLFVGHINALNKAKVLRKDETGRWRSNEVDRNAYRDLFDVSFTSIGQCDSQDCAAQREYFRLAEPVEQQEAWAYKYLVDIDGNAFSGRYYAFLQSKSLVCKVSVFREWHDEWVKPWEYLETMRYFIAEEEARDSLWNLSKTPSGLHHQIITLRNGFKFHYVCNDLPETAADSKPLVIFIHGFPDSWAIWRNILGSSSIQEGATVVAPDLPGYGGTDGLDKYTSTDVLENLTGFILAVRSKYGVDGETGANQKRTIIVGHDWGCVLSMRLASEAPELADRFILSNGPLTRLVVSNIRRLLSSSFMILKSSLRSPIRSRAAIFKALKSLQPVARQLSLSGYIFAVRMPVSFVKYLGTGGYYSFLKLTHKKSYGTDKYTALDAADCMASTLGPSAEELKTRTADGQGYPASISEERTVSNFMHMASYYRDNTALARWQKSVETIADLHNIQQGKHLRRASSGTGLFDEGPKGALKASATFVWGKADIALDPRLCLVGIGDYLVQNSQVIELPRSGHFTPLEQESRAALEKAVEWAVQGEKEDVGAAIQSCYPGAVVTMIYDELIPVHPMTNSTPANLWLMERPDLIATFTKIELWRQTQFRRIVYIDCDVVALRAPDELLDLDVDFAAVPDVGWPDCFNSGLMVLRPNLEDYFALQALAERGISFDGADQGLLNLHFKDWHRLSFTYNCTPSANYQYVPAYKHFQSTINMIHFIGSQKPWNMSRQVAPADSPYNQLLGRWWAIYDRHYRPTARAASVSDASVPEYNYRPEAEPTPLPDQSFPSPQGPPVERPPVETQPAVHPEPSWTSIPAPQPKPGKEDSTPYEAEPSEFHEPATQEPPVEVPQPQTEVSQSNIDRNVQAPFFSAVPQYVRGEEHISAYIQPQPHGAPSVTHIEQRTWVQPSVGEPISYPPSSDVIETQPSGEPEEFTHREEEHSSERSTPRPETPTFEAPKAEWDAPHEPPPLNSKPEGIALEMKTYTMSEDNQLFQPPVSYPEAPKNMYYDVPETKPEPEKLTQIFPWESHMPKPTRVFVNDDQGSLSLPSPSSTRISTESSKEDSTTQSLESAFTWTYSEPPESWENYSRSNAWDDVPEIQRYIQSIQQARKARVQVISGASSSGHGSSGQTITAPDSDTRLTHFPSEIERPSLPVTPMPIRRSSYVSYTPEEEYTAGQLPIAEGVPNQEDWVGVTVDNPLTCLEELQRRQSEVLENPGLLTERIVAAAAELRPD
ncbi:putative capsule-associated protein CAP1 [Aspergillus steynii IBT 23096]|uniref:glycogenin glucosyltransferase n=1 Tax=Aspergillus steynii IBT 23096 TaxID=1392250 RepID=A0A2I2G1M0_9EURO|nr:putative capsule-associated protein CAP1 [Aspergillus steynii IBT 23096]PLB46785.1 putative capsule-associated protein CAP1 [Aspergillus steynii IBT 23096]